MAFRQKLVLDFALKPNMCEFWWCSSSHFSYSVHRQILTMGLVLAWYIFLNLSTALRLSEKRLMVLIRAIISDRSNKAGLVLALNNTMVVNLTEWLVVGNILAYIKCALTSGSCPHMKIKFSMQFPDLLFGFFPTTCISHSQHNPWSWSHFGNAPWTPPWVPIFSEGCF